MISNILSCGTKKRKEQNCVTSLKPGGENPACYVSMYNLDKMQWMQKFYS